MSTQTEWRCTNCRTVLGSQKGDRLYIRFRKFQYVLIGPSHAVIATCGVCARTDERPPDLSAVADATL